MLAMLTMRRRLLKPRIIAPALACVGALVVLAFAPYFVVGFYLNVLTEILVYGLLATSINILMGYTGLTPLGHGAFFGVAAYTVAYLMVSHHWGFAAAFLAGLGLATAVSVLFGAVALRATGIYFLMITLALNMLVYGTAFTLYPVTNSENGLYGVTRPDFMFEDYQYYWFTLAIVAISLILIWRLVSSPFGLTLRGIRESESRMRTLGYNVFLHKIVAFSISGFFASLAGCLYVFYSLGVSPATVNLQVSVEGVLEVIIGGIGTLFGPLLGAAIIVTAREIVSLQVGRWPTVLGAVLILIVIFARNGILGSLQGWRARRRWAAPRDQSAGQLASMAAAEAGAEAGAGASAEPVEPVSQADAP